MTTCSRFALLLSLGVLTARALTAQSPTDEAQAHLAKARALATGNLLITEEIQCNELGEDDPYREVDKEDRVTPTRVFDNLYYIGTRSVGAWAIKTSAGIILVNALHTKWVNSTLLAGLTKLKLDPADVKFVVVTQGVPELYGGAKYFQDKYAAQIILSPTDWDMVNRAGALGGEHRAERDTLTGRGNRGGGGGGGGGGRGGGGFGGRGGGGMGGRGGGGGGGTFNPRGGRTPAASEHSGDDKPARDQVAFNGETFTLGDETITVFITSGHTSGTLSVIVPVSDHGQSHVAAIFGGTAVPQSHELLSNYITAIQRFATTADSAHVDVALNAYPLVDNGIARMDSLRKDAPGAANPFVVGSDGVQHYFGVLTECGWVNLLNPRREP